MSLQKLQYVKNSLNQAIKEMEKHPMIQSRLIAAGKMVHNEMLKAMANEPSRDNVVEVRRELGVLAKKQRELKNKIGSVESGSSLQMVFQRELAQNKLEIQNLEKTRRSMVVKIRQVEK